MGILSMFACGQVWVIQQKENKQNDQPGFFSSSDTISQISVGKSY